MTRFALPTTLVLLLAAGTLAQDEKTPEPSGKEPMGLTGVLSEKDFAALHELRGDQAPPLRGKPVELADGSKAYLSLPAGGTPPLAGVVVIHEWWGLNDHVRHWTDRLAADGYAALAVDLYRGTVATTREQAMTAMRGVDEELAGKTLDAALRFLGADPRIRAPRLGVVGWCFGGGWSLRTALDHPELDAAVIYYGRLVDEPARLRGIRAEVLGVFGDRDRGIPPEAVDAFEEALGKAAVRHRILRYDADHAFANPSSGRYDAKAAEDAWGKVRAFFRRVLEGKTDAPPAIAAAPKPENS